MMVADAVFISRQQMAAMNVGAGDELGGQGLIDWSRHLRYQLWWLPHLIWSVPLGGAVWVSIATASAPEATKGDQAERADTLQLPDRVAITMGAGE